VNILSGIAGTKNRRVRYTAIKAGIAKITATFTSTIPLERFLILPTRDVVPTTNKEYAVAVTGLSASKYTKIGTVKIDPPPPNKPSVRPTINAPIYPNIISIFLFLIEFNNTSLMSSDQS